MRKRRTSVASESDFYPLAPYTAMARRSPAGRRDSRWLVRADEISAIFRPIDRLVGQLIGEVFGLDFFLHFNFGHRMSFPGWMKSSRRYGTALVQLLAAGKCRRRGSLRACPIVEKQKLPVVRPARKSSERRRVELD